MNVVEIALAGLNAVLLASILDAVASNKPDSAFSRTGTRTIVTVTTVGVVALVALVFFNGRTN